MFAITVVVALAGLVWGTYFVLRGSLVAGCLIFLLCLACFGHAFVHFEVGSTPLTLDRLWLAVLVVAYLAQRRMGQADPKPLGAAEWLLLAFIGVLTASMVSHSWRDTLPGQAPISWRLVGGYLMPLTIYWIARQARLDERQWALVAGSLACFGIYLVLTGFCEVSRQWSLVFPRYIADPKLGVHFGRARGPLLQAGTCGMYVVVAMSCAWLWQRRWGRIGQFICLLSLPFYLTGVYFSYTRSVWLGAAVALSTLLALTIQRAWRPLLLGGVICGGLVVVAAKWDSLLGFKREQSAADTRESAYMRASFAYVSWLMFQDRPTFGFGFGQFPCANAPYLSDRTSELQLEHIRGYAHHNTLLSLLSETGAVGLGLFLAIVWLWTCQAWQLLRLPGLPEPVRSHAVLLLATLGVYVCQLLAYEVSFSPLENSLFFFLAGMNSGWHARHARRPTPSTSQEADKTCGYQIIEIIEPALRPAFSDRDR